MYDPDPFRAAIEEARQREEIARRERDAESARQAEAARQRLAAAAEAERKQQQDWWNEMNKFRP